MDPRYSPNYEPATIAKLLELRPGRVRQWLGSSPSADRPVLVRGADHRKPLATFLDLVELYMVRELVTRGGWRVGKLREAIGEASERLGIDHPLARRQLYVDGRALMIRDRGTVLTLGTDGQLALREVLEERMRRIDYDGLDLAARWWPDGHDGAVVIDPSIAFGAPTLPDEGVDLQVLHGMWLAEGRNAERVAWAFELSVSTVRDAVTWYDRHFARKEAA